MKDEKGNDYIVRTVRDFLEEHCETFSVENSLIKDSYEYKIVKGALEYAKQEKLITLDGVAMQDKYGQIQFARWLVENCHQTENGKWELKEKPTEKIAIELYDIYEIYEKG